MSVEPEDRALVWWPVIDHKHGHIRTPEGSIIPLSLIGIVASVALILVGIEATFGITNWISIPAAVLAFGFAIERIDDATIRHHHRTDRDQP